MNVGMLVMKRSRWELDSKNIGLILESSKSMPDAWLVLWATKNSYKLQEHLSAALMEI